MRSLGSTEYVEEEDGTTEMIMILELSFQDVVAMYQHRSLPCISIDIDNKGQLNESAWRDEDEDARGVAGVTHSTLTDACLVLLPPVGPPARR